MKLNAILFTVSALWIASLAGLFLCVLLVH